MTTTTTTGRAKGSSRTKAGKPRAGAVATIQVDPATIPAADASQADLDEFQQSIADRLAKYRADRPVQDSPRASTRKDRTVYLTDDGIAACRALGLSPDGIKTVRVSTDPRQVLRARPEKAGGRHELLWQTADMIIEDMFAGRIQTVSQLLKMLSDFQVLGHPIPGLRNTDGSRKTVTFLPYFCSYLCKNRRMTIKLETNGNILVK